MVMKPPSLSALETERLILRQWRQSDLAPFAALNADSEVMEHFPNTLTPASSQELVARITACFSEWGFGLWAVELKESGRFIGYIGLTHLSFEAHFTPCVEVGWRLAREFWGRGYAGEGGRASMQDGFLRMHLPEIVSSNRSGSWKNSA
jgi:RimJ/RimL family protein N-acetyltransferase